MSQTLNACFNRVHEFGYLGVEFDDRLSWSSHVRQMIFKESKYIYVICRLGGPYGEKL